MKFNVGVIICKSNNISDDELVQIVSLIENLVSQQNFLKFLSTIDCESLSKKHLEGIVEGIDRLLIIAENPYSEEMKDFVRNLSTLEIESYMVKIIDPTLALNGELNEEFLEREIVFWGSYLSQIDKNKMILTISRFKSKLKRRDILRLISVGFLERRFLPTIDRDACIANYGCRKCIDYCPVDALKLWDKKKKEIEVFETKCVSCGICEAVCPTTAIEVHNVNNNLIQNSFAEMIKQTQGDKPVVIASCGVRLYKELLENARGIISKENVFNLVIECVGRLDPILNISLLQMGAKGIILLDCNGNCPYRIKDPHIKENYKETRELLKAFKQDDSLVQIVDMEKEEWQRELNEAIDRMLEKESTKSEPKPLILENGDLKFKTFIVNLTKTTNTTPEGDFESNLYGPINIKVDELKCTMCNACVVNCPTMALQMKQENDKMNLVFAPINCVACKNCIEICPENAMSYEVPVDLKATASMTQIVLKSDEMARCKHCGEPFAPISDIKKVERMLKLRWKGSPKVLEHLYYCEKCKKLKVLGLI